MIQTDRCVADSGQPHSLLLQWHITERCNLRCAHCYQESYVGGELDFQELLNILEQFKALLGMWRGRTKQSLGGHITVTGAPQTRMFAVKPNNAFAAPLNLLH